VRRYVPAILLPVVMLALTEPFIRISQAPFFSLFLLGIVAAAIYGGTKPGLVATALSTLASVLSVPPVLSFRISDPDDAVRILVFSLVSTVIAVLIGSMGSIQHRLDIERKRLDVTLRSIGDAVIATDARGRVTFMNSAAEATTGWRQIEATGRSLPEVFNIVNEQTREHVENPVDKVLRVGRVVGLGNHTILIRKDGSEIPIDDSAAPIVNTGVLTGVVLVFRDVHEARQSDAALLRAEKLASVGRLAATIAHEINNPLEAVTNLLYLIGASDNLGTAKSLAIAAQQELARAAHVTKQTLSFARQGGMQEETKLQDILDGTIALYEPKARAKDVTINKRYRGDGVVILSPNDLRQVISNILSNAIDAERPGGRIDVRVQTSGVQMALRMTIADRGCGISREHMGKLFEPFFTMKQDVGTGLGLWVTKEIVDAQGGHIRVRSRVGHGTVFSISWPLASAQVREQVAESKSRKAAS
jgi:PAS domain S-box-containing protein